MTESPSKRRRRGRPRGQEVDGELVRAWRREQGLTLAATSEQLGLSERTLRTVEHGGPVSVGTIRQIAEHCGLPWERLVGASPPTTSRLLTFGFAPPPRPRTGSPRAELVDRIVEDVLDAPGVVALGGRSGIGKTWTARHVVADLADRLDGEVVWVSGASLQSPRHRLQLQQRIAEAMGFADGLPDVELVGEDAVHRAFGASFWQSARLLIIDDLPSARAARHFACPDGAPSGDCRILVTSRYRHVVVSFGPRVHMIPQLGDAQGRALLGEALEPDRLARDERAVRELLRLFAGVPRALEIASRILAREPYTPIGEFLQRVRDEPNALLPRTMADDWGRDEASEVRRHGLFELHLSNEARALHSTLAIFGGRSFDLRWAAAAHGRDDGLTRRALSELVDVFLVEEEREGAATSGLATRFRLDRHSLLTARARGTSALRAGRRRLAAFAGSELAAILAMPSAGMARAWTAAEGGFSTAFDRACAPLLATLPGSVRRPASRDAAQGDGFDSATHEVSHAVARFGPLLDAVALPVSPPWFLTGWLDALHRDDPDAAARIAALAARQAAADGRYGHAVGWIDAALADVRAPHERELLDAWAARLLALQREPDAARARLDAHPRPHGRASRIALRDARMTLHALAGQTAPATAALRDGELTRAEQVSLAALGGRSPDVAHVGALSRRTDTLTAACLFSSRSDDARAAVDRDTLRRDTLQRGAGAAWAILHQDGSNSHFVLRAADAPVDEEGCPPLTGVGPNSAEVGPIVVPASALRHALGGRPEATLAAAGVDATRAAAFIEGLQRRPAGPHE